jgi:phosphate-selective porin
MSKTIRFQFLFFAVLAWGLASLMVVTPTEAKKTIYEDEDAKLQLGVRIQTNITLEGTAEATDTSGDGVDDTVTGRNYDNKFRRARIAVGGQLSDLVRFAGQTDIGSGMGDPVVWRDYLIRLKLSSAVNVSMGLFKTQFSRSRNGSGFGQMALDRPFVESKVTNSSKVDGSIGGKRDQQIAVWGNVDKLQYRVGIGDGAATVAGKPDTLRTSFRVHYAVMDAEKGFGYKETYHGKKDIMTIGFGYDTQADVRADGANTAMTADVHFEKDIGAGVPNVNFGYYSQDVGDDTSSSQGVGMALTAGYKTGKYQPYFRWANWDAAPEEKDETRMNVGLNYLIKGHKAKIVLDYELISYETQGTTKATKDHNVMAMQWQLDF